MVKLYYTDTSCGAASFMTAYITELNLECETVDLHTHKTSSGIDFYSINPKGNVPCIVLDDGSIINENITCLQYLSDISKDLQPQKETIDYYKFNQIMSFLATELHSAFGLFFISSSEDTHIRNFLKINLDNKINYLQKHLLKNNKYIFGNSLTTADLYCHIILSWTTYIGIDLSDYPIAYKYHNNISNLENILSARKRMSENPSSIL
jgi:glutathione S-transferase